MSKQWYVFGCPMCGKRFTYDEPGEPCCTGPSESHDGHPLEVMRLLAVRKTEVPPVFAEQRATGQLILPHMTKEIDQEVELLKC